MIKGVHDTQIMNHRLEQKQNWNMGIKKHWTTSEPSRWWNQFILYHQIHGSFRFWNLVFNSWPFSLDKTEKVKEALEAVNIIGSKKQSQWGPAFLRPGRAGVAQLAPGSKRRSKPFITQLPHQRCLGQGDVKGEGFLWSVKIRTSPPPLSVKVISPGATGWCETFGCLYRAGRDLSAEADTSMAPGCVWTQSKTSNEHRSLKIYEMLSGTAVFPMVSHLGLCLPWLYR